MSDIGTTTNSAPDAAAGNISGGLTTEAAPTTPPPAPPAADVFAEPGADQAVFDRGYVERIRREGANYRSTAQQAQQQLDTFNQAFGGYAPEDRQVWLDLASTWATDPNRAAQVMQDIARAVLTPEGGETTPEGSGTTPPSAAGTSEAGDGASELTPEHVQQMIAEALSGQQQQAQQQQAVDSIYAEMRVGGYDPATMEGFMVLWLANNQTGGDIHQAMDAMKNYRQGIVDGYVSGKASGHHLTPSPNGALATTQEPVHDLRGARKAAQAFIESQIGASAGQA